MTIYRANWFNAPCQKIASLVDKIREAPVFQKAVIVVENAPQTMDGVAVYGFAGIAGDSTSKVLMGVGTVCGGVALVASSPVVSKVALCMGAGCFMSGFIRGFRKSMLEA